MSNLSTKTLPKSLTNKEVLVRTRNEDPQVLKERQEIVRSKSVSELAKISSMSDLPIPANIQKLFKKQQQNEHKQE